MTKIDHVRFVRLSAFAVVVLGVLVSARGPLIGGAGEPSSLAVSPHGDAPSIGAPSAPCGRSPAAPVSRPFGMDAESLEEEVETEASSDSRGPSERHVVSRAGAPSAAASVSRGRSETVLAVRAADFGRLCRRLL